MGAGCCPGKGCGSYVDSCKEEGEEMTGEAEAAETTTVRWHGECKGIKKVTNGYIVSMEYYQRGGFHLFGPITRQEQHVCKDMGELQHLIRDLLP